MKKFTLAILVLSVLSSQAQDFSGTLTVAPLWKAAQTNGAALSTIELGTILSQAHTYGTNAFQMNAIALRSGTLTNGQERVLSCAALTNGFGQAMNLWRVNLLIVQSTGTNNLDALAVGGTADHLAVLGATNQTATVAPGGVFMAYAPDAAGIVATGKVIRLANLGTNALSYAVYIGGAR